MKPKVAFVIHRYGAELGGGIERCCQLVAEQMQKYWQLEVLTTCARDYHTWRNEYEPGLDTINQVCVHRFPVDFPRDPQSFSVQTDRLLQQINSTPAERPSYQEQVDWMKAQGPFSSPLFHFLSENRDKYSLFVFFSYLYASTFFGLEYVADRSVLVPAAHDEPMLRLPIFRRVFESSAYNLYGALEEEQLLRHLFGGSTPGEVCGVGISPVEASHPSSEVSWPRAYLLYIGRIEHLKGCGELFSYFLNPPPQMPEVDLVLVGRSGMSIPQHPNIHPLGYVSEERKRKLLSEALALVMPSPFESLSLVLLEAWQAAKPVIVNGKCEVLKGQCLRSGGGLAYHDVISFAEAVEELNRSASRRALLGLRGLRYVQKAFNWDRVEECYLRAFRHVTGQRLPTKR